MEANHTSLGANILILGANILILEAKLFKLEQIYYIISIIAKVNMKKVFFNIYLKKYDKNKILLLVVGILMVAQFFVLDSAYISCN